MIQKKRTYLSLSKQKKTEETQIEEPIQEETEEVDDDIITSLLKEKGISDPNKVKFENEDGEIEEVPFSSLDKEEQLNILNSQEEVPVEDNEL